MSWEEEKDKFVADPTLAGGLLMIAAELEEKGNVDSATTLRDTVRRLEALERLVAHLLAHYLEGERDAVAQAAEVMVPNWRELVKEREPKA